MTGMLLALAVLMGYVEMILPVDIGFPGVKLGLANVVILYVFLYRGMRSAVVISILRTIIIASLFASPAMLMYSLSGAVVSIIVMSLLKALGKFSVYGISAAGGTAHNITQFIVAVFLAGSSHAWEYMLCLYLPVLMIAGEAAGLVNALITDRIHEKLKRTGQDAGPAEV